MKEGTSFSKFYIKGCTSVAQNHLQKMYNDQSFTAGLNLPSTSLGRSDSNGAQMLFSQGSRDLDKAQQVFQQLRKQDATDLDCSPSDCNFSHSGPVMASMGRGILENFQASAGLMRYHSAPGSFLATLAGDDNDVMHNISGTRPDKGLSQILSNDSSLTSESNSGVLKHNDSCQSSKMQQENHIKNHADYSRMTTIHNSTHLMRTASNVAEENLGKENHLATILENGIDVSQNNFCSSQMSMMCQTRGAQTAEQHLVNNTFKHNPLVYTNLDSSGETSGKLPPKNSLVRHSSLPPAALSQVPSSAQVLPQSGYPDGVMTNSNMGMTALASGNSSSGNMGVPNRLNNQMNFMRQSSSPAQLLSQLTMELDIPEVMDKLGIQRCHSSAEHLVRCDSDSARLSSVGRNQGYVSSLSARSWEDGTMIPGNYEGMQNSENISSRKRGRDMNEKMIAGVHRPEKQGEDGCHSVSALANHHFGLFKSTSAEMAMEKFLEDSVPCRIRAKRGCATHPRSIAERVRRTRISDRMRKLQELVPNMDKQTNTADMLDEAVEYVKFLQRQVQELSEKQRKCDCASRKGADVNNTQAN